MHLGPMKLYYYSNPAKTSPNEPKRSSPNDSQSVPMGVLVGAGGVGRASGAN